MNQSWSDDKQHKKKIMKFSGMFENLFRSAGYRPHTAIHPHRFPLLGTVEHWKFLRLELVPERRGRTPSRSNQDEHVLDVLLAIDLDSFARLKLNFVSTNLFPVLIIQQAPRDPADYKSKLGLNFDALKIPVFTMYEYDKDRIPMEMKTGGGEEDSDKILEDTYPRLSEEPQNTAVVQKCETASQKTRIDSHTSNNAIPRVVFDVLSNFIGSHHEKRAQNLVEEAGGCSYNPYMDGERAPDGYYFCDRAAIGRLESICNKSLRTFYGFDRFFKLSSDNGLYVLVALEAKVTTDCLEGKLDQKHDYFIYRPAPEPIRHLVLVDGGGRSRAFIELLNLAVLEARAALKLNDSVPLLDGEVHCRVREMGQKLAYGGTLVLYLPSFSKETVHDLPNSGNNDRFLIRTLYDLVRLAMRVQNPGRAANNECLSSLRNHYLEAIEVHFNNLEQELNILNYQPSTFEQRIVQLSVDNATLDVIQQLQKDVIERKSSDEGSAAKTCPQLLKKLEKVAKQARKLCDKNRRQQTRSSERQRQTTVNIIPAHGNEKCSEEKDPFTDRMVRQKSLSSIDENSAGGTHSDEEDYKFGAQAE